MKKKSTIFFAVLLLIHFSCRKPYEPAVIKVDYNYLVIDGVINAGANAVSTIKLTRTKNLNDTTYLPKPETGAQVVIEGQSGGSFSLASQGNGSYQSQSLNLSAANKYRLKITTSNGSVYQS